MRRFIGALTTKGAVSLSQRRPATKVWVIQCPKGALQRSRWPFAQRPRRRVILVVVPVSSRKTSRCGSSRIRGWRVVVHSSRDRVRAILLARQQSFFEAVAVADEP